jgi:hypothetical protein
MKRKKAVRGRFMAFGFLPFFSVLAFFDLGSVALDDFFLQIQKQKQKV